MDKIYVVLIAVSALILLYILWCFIEPFFLDQDRATLKKTPDDSSPAGSITIKKLPMVQSDAENAPDFRFVFFSDTHAEWCPVSSRRICESIRKTHEKVSNICLLFPIAARNWVSHSMVCPEITISL